MQADEQAPLVLPARARLHQARLRAHRILALLCLFDFLFIALLWGLVSQGFHGTFSNVRDSIESYHFKSSLFDVVCAALLRFLIFIVAYWFVRSDCSWFVVFTTSTSTAFLMTKVFYYSFETDQHAGDYIVFISAFCVPFAEAWAFISRIAPLDKKIARLYMAAPPLEVSSKYTSYGAAPAQCYGEDSDDALGEDDELGGFHTPPDGSAVQSDEDEVPHPRRASRPDPTSRHRHASSLHPGPPSRTYQRQQQQQQHKEGEAEWTYQQVPSPQQQQQRLRRPQQSSAPAADTMLRHVPSTPAAPAQLEQGLADPHNCNNEPTVEQIVAECVTKAWSCAADHNISWHFESDANGVGVSSKLLPDRVYRSEGFIFAAPSHLFEYLADMDRSAVAWHRVFEHWSIEDYSDSICFVDGRSRPLGKGLIGARNFTSVQHWCKHGNGYVIVWSHFDSPEVEPCTAKFGADGLVLLPVEGQPLVTNLIWVFDADFDVSRWLPAAVVQQAFINLLVSFHEGVREGIADGAAPPVPATNSNWA
jgi:hypothetical protein